MAELLSKKRPKIVQFVTLIVYATALAGIIVVFLLSNHLRRGEQIIWGAKFIKLLLEDTFLSTIISLIANFITIRIILKCRRIPKLVLMVLKFLTDHTLLSTMSLLTNYKYLPPSDRRDVKAGYREESNIFS